MFEKAVDWGLIERNPMTRVKQLRLPKAEPTYLSLEEFQRLWKALPSQWHRDIVTLAMLTGLRREEFIELTWSDVNLRERVLRVSHGKGDRERFVPINEECVRVLQSIPRTGARPFPYKRNTVSQMFRSARIRAGMNPGLHFHSLRHSFATLTLKNGAAVQDVQKIMGHASITTTMGYTHLVSRDMHDAVAKLPNLKIGTGGS
jgi:integrase